jgi:hypothetical protein
MDFVMNREVLRKRALDLGEEVKTKTADLEAAKISKACSA